MSESLAYKLEKIANRMDFLYQGANQKTLRAAAAALRAQADTIESQALIETRLRNSWHEDTTKLQAENTKLKFMLGNTFGRDTRD